MNASEKNSKTLWSLMQGHRLRYFSALVAMFCGVSLLYLTPLVTRGAIDGVIDSHPAAGLSWAAEFLAGHRQRWGTAWTLSLASLAVILMTASAAAFMNLQGRLSGVASETIVRRLRDRLYAHLQHVPMTWHDKVQTGDIVQRCTSDVDTVRLFYREQVIEISRACLRILIGVPILLWLDWKMGLTAMALMPVIVGFAIVFFGRVQGSFKKADESEGFMTAALQENLTGIRVVRAFARQEFEIGRFYEKEFGLSRQAVASFQDHGALLVHFGSDVLPAVFDDRVRRGVAGVDGDDDRRDDDRVRFVRADVHLADQRSWARADGIGKDAGGDYADQGGSGGRGGKAAGASNCRRGACARRY